MPGDIVRLKSAARPQMTVAVIEPQQRVMCNWFDDRGHAQCYTFKPETLVKVSCRNAPASEPQVIHGFDTADGYRD